MAGIAKQMLPAQESKAPAVAAPSAVEAELARISTAACTSSHAAASTMASRPLSPHALGLGRRLRRPARGDRARCAHGRGHAGLQPSGGWPRRRREQGITIDIAWRYFELPARRLVIIDSPGHVQYTRNMATGASHADVALLLVDARSGVKEQTRRHLAILQLVGVQRVILAVNKMDLAAWSQERFAAIEATFRGLAERLGFLEVSTIPVSAVLGDNVARRSENMPWYAGPPLLDVLRAIPARAALIEQPFRFPVQLVVRDGADFRGLAGTVTSAASQSATPCSTLRADVTRGLRASSQWIGISTASRRVKPPRCNWRRTSTCRGRCSRHRGGCAEPRAKF